MILEQKSLKSKNHALSRWQPYLKDLDVISIDYQVIARLVQAGGYVFTERVGTL
jgi:hypothetical protein